MARFLLSVALLSVAQRVLAHDAQPGPYLESDKLVDRARLNMCAREHLLTDGRISCGVENAAVRKEWDALSHEERQDWIDAVWCLGTLPTTLDPQRVPGARSRYDDFVFAHMEQAGRIHNTGNFLTWHRHYVHSFETTLRNECGYKGYQPYWNWARHSDDQRKSAVFDGSDFSLGGTGAYQSYSDYNTTTLTVTNQGGGGCLTDGPFKDWPVNLGPVLTKLDSVPRNSRPDGYGYNPRCIRRDLNPVVSAAALKDSDVVQVLSEPTSIGPFDRMLNGIAARGIKGVHGSGHFTIGGDPGSDFYASPADPSFWLHHAMLDRVFWAWQNQVLENHERVSSVSGTLTPNNVPPSANATLDDVIGSDVVGTLITIRAGLDTMSGSPYCYYYE